MKAAKAQLNLICILVLNLYKILALTFAFVTVYYITSINQHESRSENVSRFTSNCPLHTESCLLLISESERLELSLSPPNLPSFKRLELNIKSERMPASNMRNLRAWLEGRDMDMGRHYFQFLERVEADYEVLRGHGMIPFCSIDRNMAWRLVVEYDLRESHRQLIFELDKTETAL